MNNNNTQNPVTATAKIFIVGDFGIGKTSLITRYWEGAFFEDTKSLNFEHRTRTNQVQDKKIKLHVWDTLGHEKYKTISPNFYRGSLGIIFCYAANNKSTFDNLEYWRDQVENNGGRDACKIMIATKSDMPNKEVDKAEGERKAKEWGIDFFETSSKEDLGVGKAIDFLAQQIKTIKVDPHVNNQNGRGNNQNGNVNNQNGSLRLNPVQNDNQNNERRCWC